MVDGIVGVALSGAALIHLLPVVGVFSVAQLERLYGVPITDPTLAVLLRHRALLFGVLGALLLAAVVERDLRWPVITATLVSDLGFLTLMRSHPGTTPAMARVWRADILSVALLLGATAAAVLSR